MYMDVRCPSLSSIRQNRNHSRIVAPAKRSLGKSFLGQSIVLAICPNGICYGYDVGSGRWKIGGNAICLLLIQVPAGKPFVPESLSKIRGHIWRYGGQKHSCTDRGGSQVKIGTGFRPLLYFITIFINIVLTKVAKLIK